ncbi:MAG: penicillin-binding transpeptidase domain-containing protein [Bacillota bacterium]|nr:penicillin-binding transpeptidase domain-containing protein [Bacillota bacterium]
MLVNNDGDKKPAITRYSFLYIVTILVILSLLAKLVVLQVVDAQEYKANASTKSHKLVSEPAPRGIIVDKGGTELATNVLSYMLIFTETEESDAKIFETMPTVFKILDENGEGQRDDFELKINPYRFEFNSSNPTELRNLELRFKKDRGLDEEIIHRLYKNKTFNELNNEQKKKVDEELLKITPEETYKKLLHKYDIIGKKDGSGKVAIEDLTKKYSPEEVRRLLVVKDEIKMGSFSGYKPVIIAADIKKETAFTILQKASTLPGIDIQIQPMRKYPYGQLASSVLGYISKVNSPKLEEKGYDTSTDYMGVSGIEGVYEDRLKGEKGGKLVEVNKSGRTINELAQKQSHQGQKIQLTIDKDIQNAGEIAFDKTAASLRAMGKNEDDGGITDTSNATRGAALCMNVKTGEILALISRPGFDPNDFSDPRGLTQEQINKYFSIDYTGFAKQHSYDEQRMNELFPQIKTIEGKSTVRKDTYDLLAKPLYNYATSSLIPPGSTFKLVTAIAGLETGTITSNDTVDDRGEFDDGNGFKTEFKSDGSNGTVNLTKAIGVSSNPYFMKLAQKLRTKYGDDILAEYAWKFGLGVKPSSGVKPSTGIEISENFGQVYNTWSSKNNYSTQYLYVTMQALKNGKESSKGASCTTIDIYDRDGDSDDVKTTKTQIKALIKDCIKDGKFGDRKAEFKQLFKDLMNEDPQYLGKDISDVQMNNILQVIYNVAISDGHFQSTTGSNIYNASIGQGQDFFTPLQLVSYLSTIVNGGTRYKAHLVNKIYAADGKTVLLDNSKPEVLGNTGIKPSTVEALKEGMLDAVTNGTAAHEFDGFPIQTAGKTGTATYNDKQIQDSVGRSAYAFYAGFAPYNDPEIAVVVVIFDGGYGKYAAPVARAMYEAYFKDRLKSQGYQLPDYVNAMETK